MQMPMVHDLSTLGLTRVLTLPKIIYLDALVMLPGPKQTVVNPRVHTHPHSVPLNRCV